MNIEIKKDEERQLFVAEVDGEEAGGLKWQVLSPGVRAFVAVHTGEDYRGQGIAGKVTEAAFEDARSEGYKVKPICPYVVSWVPKHPEVDDLIA